MPGHGSGVSFAATPCFLLNLDRCGNTSAASVALVLDENLRNGTIKPGNLVLTMGFGGGLTWAATLLRW